MRILLILLAFTLWSSCTSETPEPGLSPAEGLVPSPPDICVMDSTGANVRIHNLTDLPFISTTITSVESTHTFPVVEADGYSAYQAFRLDVSAVEVRTGSNTILSPPVCFFGTILDPGLYTYTVSIGEDASGMEVLTVSRETDVLF